MSDTATANENALAIVDLKSFSAPDLTKAKELVKTINPSDTNSLMQYGVGAQSKISGFADSMLSQIRTKDAGDVGESLTNLVFRIKDAGVGDLGKMKPSLFSSIFNQIQRFMAKYEKLETQIDKIVNDLEKSKMNMMRDIAMLDQLYQKNIEYLHDLDLFIAGGQMRLEELRTVDLPKMQVQAQTSADPMDAQRLNDFNAFLNRFEKKLYDLKLSRMIAIQTAPQVRLIQNNDNALVEKIQSSIMTTIPLWKSQVVIAITILRQKKAADVQKAVTDETNELLAKNSEDLKIATIAVAKEMERGIVEVETLQKTNDNLIATIEETIRIQEEGKTKRAEAEKQLTQIEADLKAKLTQVRN